MEMPRAIWENNLSLGTREEGSQGGVGGGSRIQLYPLYFLRRSNT